MGQMRIPHLTHPLHFWKSVLFLPALVEGGIDGVEIAGVHVLLRNAECITETLIVHKLALAQVAQRIADIGIVAQTDQVVVGDTRLLLCYYHVFATKLSLIKVRKILIL